MQYSLRTRRRLRPSTGDVTHAAAAATRAVELVRAERTGVTRQPLVTVRIVERVAPRAVVTAFRR